jgi:hypothetical protein
MRLLSALAAIVAVLAAGAATAGPIVDGPLASTRSIGDLIAAQPGKPLHIIFVHGMRTSLPGSSQRLLDALCRHVRQGCTGPSPTVTVHLDLGQPPPASSFGVPIWSGPDDWQASRPFVDHHVFRRPGGASIIVDEINWWPLLLPLKCQFLVEPDTQLAGPDKADLDICSDAAPPRHPWIAPEQAKVLKSGRPISGGGALVNRGLKTQILNWGLADAVITLGPLKQYTRLAVWCAFEEIAAFDPDVPRAGAEPHDCSRAVEEHYDQQFVVISESLGSFLLLDSFADAAYDQQHPRQASPQSVERSAALRFIFDRSDNLYFLANQVPLLELGRIEGVYAPPSGPAPAGSIRNALGDWASSNAAPDRPRQIIAFSDPSDMLSYRVPRIDPAVVVNVYVRNGFSWFGLYENPAKAHTRYSANRDVLRIIFGH